MQFQLEPGTLNPRSLGLPLRLRLLDCRKNDARLSVIEPTAALRAAQRSVLRLDGAEQLLWFALALSSAALVVVSFYF